MKPVKLICEREQIPHPFAYKILKKLEHAGIVNSYRGAVGGYQLAKAPESITLFDIVRAVDDNLCINECLQEGYVCARFTGGSSCGVRRELTRIQEILVKALCEKTMDVLI
jgi:Rrf2 family protein